MDTAEGAMLRDGNNVHQIAHEVANTETGDDNLVENMVDMIQAQRSFEANAVVITTADEMLDEILSM